MAVKRCRVEIAHSGIPGALHHGIGDVFRDRFEKIADGRRAEAHIGDRETRPPEFALLYRQDAPVFRHASESNQMVQ